VIAEANGLAAPYVVKAGQTLIIPRQRSYTVKPGDTALGIALRHDISLDQLAQANSLNADHAVRIGQRLIIPAIFTPPASPTQPADPAFVLPHDGTILLGWRRRPDGGGHAGIDFAVNPGDMVRAAASGTVLYAGEEPRRFGRLVLLDHGNGWWTLYGHLQAVTVAKGDAVKAGERIGLGGQGGSAERPELHFEIRRNGKPVDPAPRLGLRR
jgi:murein DD-endopeptidase MepM/ murein hydrolase activator NlpD